MLRNRVTGSLEQVLREIRPLDEAAMAAARARQDTLTKPTGSLGRLEELSIRLAGITAAPMPRIVDRAIVTMAADHGVAVEGVSAYPQEVTAQMVHNFLTGGAGINVLARLVGARVVVVDMGVATAVEPQRGLVSSRIGAGTRDMTVAAAMTREQAIESIQAGLDIVQTEAAGGLDIIGTGDMGIGNTTASSAIASVVTGEPVAAVTGRGTGIDDERLDMKVATIEKALRINRPDPGDPIDVLSKVGGFEIGGLCGVILAAASRRVPVVIDGFISGAAALIAASLSPATRDYMIASHLSVEAGHGAMLRHMGLRPLLDLELRLGEGTGAALGIFLAEAAARVLTEMATFAEAGVSQSDEVKD